MNVMSRRNFLKSLATSAAALTLSSQATKNLAQAGTRPPNVVFILADDLGWVDTHLYGSRYYDTPNVDALARRGMMFTQAYAANPLCSPTRASIMTGLWPARIGITAPVCHVPQIKLEETVQPSAPPTVKTLVCSSATRLKLEYQTLAETFKSAGYRTGHFGKWHLGSEPYDPLHQGFDVDMPHWPGPGPAGSYVAPWKFPKFKPETELEHIEDRMAREAVGFIKENKAQGKPFYMSYWMFSVHAPFDAKKELIEQYRAKVDKANPQRCPTYAAMVKSMDDAVGTLVRTLDEEGLAENTIIVFTSDNGGNMYDVVEGETPTSNAPLRLGKGCQYEGGVRVPLLVIWPGRIKAGAKNETDLVQSIDYYPTLLEMTGLKVQPEQKFDGVSIMPALKGGKLERDTIFCHFPHATPAALGEPSTWVRKGDWKLIRFYCGNPDQTDRYELYNLKGDIGETKNMASAMPDKVKELGALIERFLKDSGAVLPKANPAYNPMAQPRAIQGKKKARPAPGAARKAKRKMAPEG